jgi:ubiquinol-cytochrome c reductase cytochrome b subunit
VAVLPWLAFLILGFHVLQVFQHGTAVSSSIDYRQPHLPYWPYQSVRNIAAMATLLAIISALAWWRGAPLDAPADPSLPSSPRPEWYFLFLFELRRYFSGDWEIVATLLIPLGVLIVLLAMPAVDRWLPRRLGAAFRLLVVTSGLAGWGSLTYLALARDWQDPEFQEARQTADRLAARARELADSGGIPPEGAIALLRNDPHTRAPLLFADHCAACHRFGDRFQAGEEASDLEGFATASWIRELLRDPGSPRFFGRTRLTQMKQWVEKTLTDVTSEEQAELDRAAQWLAGHPRGLPRDGDDSEFARGFEAFTNWCIDCHKYEGEGGTDLAGPDFTGYGSQAWIRQMLFAPDSAERYGKRSSMPSFANKLTDREVEMLLGWISSSSSPAVRGAR